MASLVPSNREWAILFWIVMFLLWGATHAKVCTSMLRVLRLATKPKVLIPLFVMICWVSLEILLAVRFIHWNSALTKGAVVWFLTAGIVLLGDFEKASKEAHFFRRKVVETIAWPAFVEFYLDLHHLPLLAEIALQPVVVVLATLPIVAARDPQLRWAKGGAEKLIALVGFCLLVFVTHQTLRGWDALDKRELLLELALPLWLTIGALPFIYLLAVYGACELAFIRLRFIDVGSTHTMRSRLAILVGLGLRPREISALRIDWLRKIAEAPTFCRALTAVRAYRRSLRRADLRKVQERRRLERFAGVAGTDANGSQLDKREFKETAAALRYVGLCMRGHYKRRLRYRDDMLAILDGSFERYGLKEPSGIEVRVSVDGQSWCAWRRTTTGWCFGVGSAGPPPDEWQYDGPEPPETFPILNGPWRNARLLGEAPNWLPEE